MKDNFDITQFNEPTQEALPDDDFDITQFNVAPDYDLSVSDKATNIAKGAAERGGDIAGAFLEGIDITAKALEAKYPLGGFEWADGDILPTYLSGKELAEKQPESILAEPAEALKNADFGYEEQKNWQDVKDAFAEGGAFSGSAYANVVEYGLEQGLKSVPDMVGAVFALPAYLIARSEEIGQERATNKGKESAELVDILEAAPFAIGSALMERVGARGMTSDVVEDIGAEVLKSGIRNAAKEIAKAGGKGLGKEAATEFIQEGMIEYAGEKFGTKAKMSFEDALDRGVAGAVAGGITGGAIASTTATLTEGLKGISGDKLAPDNDIPDSAVPDKYKTQVDDSGNPIADPNAIDDKPPAPGGSGLPFVPDQSQTTGDHTIGQPTTPVQLTDTSDSLGGGLDVGASGDALNTELGNTDEVAAAEEQQGQIIDGLAGPLNQLFETETTETETTELETELKAKEVEIQRAHDSMDMALKEELEIEAEHLKTEIEAAQKTEMVEATPSEKQIEAGNYKKVHKTVQGLDISIETPAQGERSGTDASGNSWSVTMQNDYGYIKRTEGADGDQVDVFIGEDTDSETVFIVDQINPETGKFDEHKVIIGATTEAQATEIYNSNYSKDWKGLGTVTSMSMAEFKTWLKDGDTKSAVAESQVETVQETETAHKQLWEMTSSEAEMHSYSTEHAKLKAADEKHGSSTSKYAAARPGWDSRHMNSVEAALKAGKPVPDAVVGKWDMTINGRPAKEVAAENRAVHEARTATGYTYKKDGTPFKTAKTAERAAKLQGEGATVVELTNEPGFAIKSGTTTATKPKPKPKTKSLSKIQMPIDVVDANGKVIGKQPRTAAVAIKQVDKKREVAKKLLRCIHS